MRFLPFIHCFVFWTELAILLCVLLSNPKNIINRLCSALLGCFALWSFGFIFIHNNDVSKQTAMVFMNIASIGWISFWAIFFLFSLNFTGEIERFNKKILYPALVTITVLLIYKQWTGHLIGDLVKVSYGWANLWVNSIWFYFFCIYYVLIIGSILFSIAKTAFMSKNWIERKQAGIIFTCTAVVLLVGSVTDVILPKLGIYKIPNIVDIVAILWTVGLVYAIVKYEFLILTPENAADNIISTMKDSLILISPEGKIISANNFTYELLGYENGELVDKPINTILSGEGIDLAFLQGHSEDKEKRLIKNNNMLYKTKENQEIPVSFTGTIIEDRDQNLVGVVGIARDMRNLNKLANKEKELAVAEVLAAKEHQKAEELNKAYNELKDTQAILVQSEKLRALGQLGAGVAHELNSPLAGIMCLMRSIKKQKNPDSEEYQDLESMEKGCEFMATIIRYLSDFTKDSKDEFKELNFHEVVESTLVLLSPQLIKQNIKIKKQFFEKLSFIKGERRKLQQLVMNMLTNARDAIGKNGEINIITKPREQDGIKYAEIVFGDTGCGIKEELRDKVFDPFFTTKTDGKGVGLGLSIVKTIIGEHKGFIKVESEEGKGTSFIIRLPLA